MTSGCRDSHCAHLSSRGSRFGRPKNSRACFLDLWMYQYVPMEGDCGRWCAYRIGDAIFFEKCQRVRSCRIEAHPKSFAVCLRCAKKNRLENATLVQAAVADQEGEVQLSDSDEHEGNSLIKTGSGIRVAATTLDSIFRSHDFLAEESGPNAGKRKPQDPLCLYLKQSDLAVSFREPEGRWIRDFVYGRTRSCSRTIKHILTIRLTEPPPSGRLEDWGHCRLSMCRRQ